jgi:hypothetical protein
MSSELDATSHGGGDIARELRSLATQIVSLQADVRRLETAPLPREGDSGWAETAPASFAWISSLEPPRRTAIRVPRLPFELAFLAGAATLAGFAHLRPLVIGAVMAVAWAIVALAEWAGSRGDRVRQRLLLEAPARAPEPEAIRADPTWFTPPVEHTLLARSAEAGKPEPATPEAETIVAKLPSPPESETTAERRPGG